MPVWWGCFIYMIVMAALGSLFYKNKQGATAGAIKFSSETNNKSIGLFWALAAFALLIFYVGQRSYIFDSTDYQYAYDNYYTYEISQIWDIINGSRSTKGPLFAVLLVLFKSITHGTYNDWFTFLAIIQGLSIALLFYKYSTNFLYSVFLFMSSSCFLWMVNGIRQFLAVAVVLFFVKWIEERKTMPFILIVLIAYGIHSSAILWIPVYFIINMEPWSNKFIVLSSIGTVVLLFLSGSSILDDTTYSYLVDYNSRGVNPIRVIVMSMPAIIAFIRREKIKEKASSFINMCINLSVICAECYIVGMFTNGIIGRIPIYFQMFSYISLPWLIKNAFEEDLERIVTMFCVIGFMLYFIYDMYIAGNGIYNSSLLDIHYV